MDIEKIKETSDKLGVLAIPYLVNLLSVACETFSEEKKMKLTLNKAWELCLKQWKWVAKQIRDGNVTRIDDLKDTWLEENGFPVSGYPIHGCFFCGYAGSYFRRDCLRCPARKVSPSFDCENDRYHYLVHPLKFYAKLLELNRKRKKLKRLEKMLALKG